MKTDLASSIGVAIAGAVIAYLLCNLIVVTPMKEANEWFTVKSVDSSFSTDLSEPNVGIFNYKALNPTVEVYVGNCEEYNAVGECVDTNTEIIEEDVIEETTNESSTNTESNTTPESRDTNQGNG